MNRIYLLIVLPLLVTFTLRGDTIELKTGERIDGVFKQATAAGAVIEVGGQAITIAMEKLKAIYFGAAPSVTVANSSTSLEAFDSLKALRSVTNSGIAYRDYSQRVLDAKVKVDRYLSSPGGDGGLELRKAIDLAMREYELASALWNIKIQDNGWTAGKEIGEAILNKPENLHLLHCSSIQNLITPGRSSYRDARGQEHPPVAPKRLFEDPNPSPLIVGMYLVDASPSAIWPCASEQLAEAERLSAQH